MVNGDDAADSAEPGEERRKRLLELPGNARYSVDRHIGDNKAGCGNGLAKQGGTTILSSLQVFRISFR